eukprot:scaffold583365_cov25-Prasinocladus_malaysianus.AAC.1
MFCLRLAATGDMSFHFNLLHIDSFHSIGFDPNGAMVAMAQLSSPLSLEHELRMLDAAIAGLSGFLRQYSDPELQGAQSPEDVDTDW